VPVTPAETTISVPARAAERHEWWTKNSLSGRVEREALAGANMNTESRIVERSVHAQIRSQRGENEGGLLDQCLPASLFNFPLERAAK
jgi:hypothetical protein